MPKTKYPNQIDTPSDLPIVRNNILEVGAEAINSLRSAIVQIEKVLGINPQGAIGNTVASRISGVIDDSGNIKPESLEKIGILTSPVLDDHISKVAAIKESKLKLDFPTSLLQTEISYLSSTLDEINAQIESLSAIISAHVNVDATNRHPASAITVNDISDATSDLSTRSLTKTDLQSTISEIYSSHINYSGANISEVNSSHTSKQIYFDNATVGTLESDNVQDAIDELSGINSSLIIKHQNIFHSNSVSNLYSSLDPTDSSFGYKIANDITILSSANLGPEITTRISFSSPLEKPDVEISLGDFLTINYNSNITSYQIQAINYSSDNLFVESIDVFGNIFNNISNGTASIYLNKKAFDKNVKIIGTAKQEWNLSSSHIISISNPSSPSVISSGINPALLNASNRYFSITFDEKNSITVDCFNPSLTRQSVDSIVKKINEAFDQNFAPASAYRIDLDDGVSEILINHNISSLESPTSSLKISRSLDSGIDAAGFTSSEDFIFYGKNNQNVVINGQVFSGLAKKLETELLSYFFGTNTISVTSSSVNFLTSGIKIGDTINVIGSSATRAYTISSVSESKLSIDPNQIGSGFLEDSLSTDKFIIYDNCLSVKDLEFLEVDSTFGSSLIEIFLDQNQNILYNKILEYRSVVTGTNSLFQIVGFDLNKKENLSSYDLIFEKNTDDLSVLAYFSGEDQKLKITGDGGYFTLKSNVKNLNITVFIPSKNDLYTYLTLIPEDYETISVYFKNKINEENNLKIGQIVYENYLGALAGGIGGPRFFSSVNDSPIGKNLISKELREELFSKGFSETRSSGVVRGLSVTEVSDGDSNYLISYNSGVCYVAGKRFEIIGKSNLDVGINFSSYDNFYIGIDLYGNIVCESSDPLCNYPWQEEEVVVLAKIERSSSINYIYDLRLFINDLDLRLLNSITVSPQPGMGHFSSFIDAIKYAKRFSQIYPKAGIPEIHLKSGTYSYEVSVSTDLSYEFWEDNVFGTAGTPSTDKTNFFTEIIKSGLYLDFPVSISGEGFSTKLNIKRRVTSSGSGEYVDNDNLYIFGAGFNTSGLDATIYHDTFSDGVITFKNINFNSGGIALIDLNNYNASNENYNFKINIDNISLNNSIKLYEITNTSNYKGNISISNSNLFGPVTIRPLDSSVRYKHISLINNNFEADLITTMMYPPLTTSISDYPAENDIRNIGNGILANSTSNRVDRVSYDLFVPNNLSINNNVSISGKYNIIDPNRDGTSNCTDSPVFRFEQDSTIIPIKLIKPVPAILYKIHPSSISANNIVYDSTSFAGIYASSSTTTSEIKLILPISDYFTSSMYQNYTGDGSQYATAITSLTFAFQGTYNWPSPSSDVVATIEVFLLNAVGATTQLSSLTTNVTKTNLQTTTSFYSPSIDTSGQITLANVFNHYAVVTLKCGTAYSSPKLYSSVITANVMGIHPG